MGLVLNRETGVYEQMTGGPASRKMVGLLVTVLTVLVSVVTYTITITLAYTNVKQEIALLHQQLDMRVEVERAQHEELIKRIDRLETDRSAVITAIQANTETLRLLAQRGGR